MVKELLDAQNKVVGLKQILRELEKDNVTKIYLADDADEEIRQKVISAANGKPVELVRVKGMEELGEICKIDVRTACAGLVHELKKR